MPTYSPVVNVLGAYSEKFTGKLRRRSGWPTTTEGCQMYWPLPSLSLSICSPPSGWKIHWRRGQYCDLTDHFAAFSPSKVIDDVVLPVDTSRPVEMPSDEAVNTPSGCAAPVPFRN